MNSSLSSDLSAVLEGLSSRLALRRSGIDLSFVFSSRVPFLPDYLHLGKFGRTRFESILNRALSAFYFQGWEDYVFSRVRKRMLSSYQNQFLILSPIPHSDLKQIVSTLYRELPKVKGIEEACFMDLFRMLGELSRRLHLRYVFHPDPFLEVKTRQNQRCLDILIEIHDELKAHSDFESLMHVFLFRTNWIDNYDQDIDAFFHAFHEEINEYLDEGLSLNSFKTTHWFHHEVLLKLSKRPPCHILYHLDNSGEVVFDLYFIQYLVGLGHVVSVCSKSSPFLNDVTISELYQLIQHPFFLSLMEAMSRGAFLIIDSNSHVAGLDLEVASEAYKDAYARADLLILKGQGHFQSLPVWYKARNTLFKYPYKKPMLYIYGLKADLVRLCFKQVLPEAQIPPLGTPVMFFNR